MENQFYILSCLTKSKDRPHSNDANLHLISSTVLVRDTEKVNIFIDKLSEGTEFKRTMVFFIGALDSNDNGSKAREAFEININNWNKKKYTDQKIKEPNFYGDIYQYNHIDLDNFLNLISKKENNNYFYNLFNWNDENTNLSLKCLFIFDNISWSNIVLKFKINNIILSEGSIPNRHLLTTSDIILNYFLAIIYRGDFNEIMKISYNSYKHEKHLLSSQISLDLYNNYIDIIPGIIDLSPSDLAANLEENWL